MSEENTPPLPGYEGMPLAMLRHRIRSLGEEDLHRLMAYEREHAARTGVLEVLTARLDAVRQGAEPSEGDQGFQPEAAPPPAGGSPVGPASAAPASNPPPHGDPAQPARPKGDHRPGGGTRGGR
ncbi:hypothetical protein [Nocardiopsis suaedae]|uniref:DUF8129 domain-containing protein n=1 Tax=Nocardiopsis suaedae TaxID=3018444 RepID=A0ABT4TGN1_9ACTN|nr:hypothetical protein [Nocardiopsis suaedae]MDA2803868.1 hypothetical protein [Nocardiopsis suaedae]